MPILSKTGPCVQILASEIYNASIPSGGRGENSKTVIKAVSYIHIKIILFTLIQACHPTLFQSYHQNLFVSVHIKFILLFMHITEFHTILIYHHWVFNIFHHQVHYPTPCCQTYFLLRRVLIPQGGWVKTWVLGGIRIKTYWRGEG